MLDIRPEQVEVFEEVAVRQFDQRAFQHLWQHCPDECARAGEQAIRAMIPPGRERAAAYGLLASADVLRFLSACLVMGPGFEAEPRAQAILTDPSLAPAAKMDAIDAHVIRHLAKEDADT